MGRSWAFERGRALAMDRSGWGRDEADGGVVSRGEEEKEKRHKSEGVMHVRAFPNTNGMKDYKGSEPLTLPKKCSHHIGGITSRNQREKKKGVAKKKICCSPC